MKMRAIVTLLIALSGLSTAAQVSVALQGGAIFSKPKATLNEQTSGMDFLADSRTGYSAGMMADIPFGEGGLRLMPELNYVSKGLKGKNVFSVQQTQIGIDLKSAIGYVELPVNLAYSIPLGDHYLVFGAGPYAAIGLHGKTKAQVTVNNNVQEEEEDITFGSAQDQLKRFDYGANAMVGFIMNNGLMLKANYSLGLSELSNDPASPYKNRYLGVSLAYFFLK